MRFELPADKMLKHETAISVRWGDMDAMGHVNNTIYFRYFEIARLE
jgi:acyl-CoA thioester hydrolase